MKDKHLQTPPVSHPAHKTPPPAFVPPLFWFSSQELQSPQSQGWLLSVPQETQVTRLSFLCALAFVTPSSSWVWGPSNLASCPFYPRSFPLTSFAGRCPSVFAVPWRGATSSRFLCASFQSGCLSAWWSWGSSSSSCWWGSAGASAARTAAAAMSAARAAPIPAAAPRPVSRELCVGRCGMSKRNVTSPSDCHVPWVLPLSLTSGFREDHPCSSPPLHAHLHAHLLVHTCHAFLMLMTL